MVLPVRIELTTSALPRMRSTTELRQHNVWRRGAASEAGLWPWGGPNVKATCRLQGKFTKLTRMSDEDRKARLAAALRGNLRRRKAQARESVASFGAPAQPQNPSNDDGDERQPG